MASGFSHVGSPLPTSRRTPQAESGEGIPTAQRYDLKDPIEDGSRPDEAVRRREEGSGRRRRRLREAGSDESVGEGPVVVSVDTRLCDWMRLETRSGVPFRL